MTTTDADELAADADDFARANLAGIDAAVDALAFDIDLDRTTDDLDAVMAGLQPADWSPAARRDLLVGYTGFPFWDVLNFTITNSSEERRVGEGCDILGSYRW